MKEIFSEGGLLDKSLPGFEFREGQLKMAQAVDELLAKTSGTGILQGQEHILMVEAETGIGKTLAYLIPVILAGRRAVVSTATINLQDQILLKEIPVIESVFGTDIGAVCVKGRQNYLCLYRWNQYRSSTQLSLVEDPRLQKITDWLDETMTGDRSELDWLEERSPLWPNISATSSQCLGSECPDGSLCFVNRVRRQAGSAKLIIVNHHLFFSDLAIKKTGFGEILPRYEVAIFDEAHHLEKVATMFFGKSFSEYQFIDLLADVERLGELELEPGDFDPIIGAGRGLKSRLDRFMSHFPQQMGRYPLDNLVRRMDNWPDEVETVAEGLRSYGDKLGEMNHLGEGWRNLEERCLSLRDSLLEVALGPARNHGEETVQIRYVHWYEKRKRSVVISATPIQVAAELRELLYANIGAIVFTSATLTTAGSFSYIWERLGLDEEITAMRFRSPFDYQDRTLLYIPENSFPEPGESLYSEEVKERICDLVLASKGRALVLFTSFKGMAAVAEYLPDRVPYPVLVQGEASRHSLLEQFAGSSESVLLAVASFWEGVDVAGESLSCVIIDKLPFEVPSDPVIRARIEEIDDSGGRPFFDFQVPRAVLSLRQGVGRLMRTTTDRGGLAILDVRLFSKGYGKIFLGSMPDSPIVRDLNPVVNFFYNGNDEKQQ